MMYLNATITTLLNRHLKYKRMESAKEVFVDLIRTIKAAQLKFKLFNGLMEKGKLEILVGLAK